MFFVDSDPTVNPLNEWLKSYGIWISFAMAGVVFTVVLVFFIIAMVKRKNNPTYFVEKKTKSVETQNILEALGGLENIVAHSLNGSRIVLVLKDYSLVREDTLNENGIDSIQRQGGRNLARNRRGL